MRKLKSCLMASAAIGCFGVAQPAQAQEIMGGGATFPSIMYRQIMDCLWHPIGDGTTGPGPMAISGFCPSPTGQVVYSSVRQYYAPTGSGNGKAAFKANSNNALTSPISASNTVPYTSSTIPNYPWPIGFGLQYIGSDDTWNATDVASWNAGSPSNQTKFGNVIQLPAVAGMVTIPYKGTDGTGANLIVGSSGLNLSRKALCGIMSGRITKWQNSIIAADNGGTVGNGQITVVHRSDGSGTNFLFTSALAEQCRFQYGPEDNDTSGTIVSYAFPWTDHTIATSLCSTTLLEPQGSNQHNWPDQFPTDQCGNAVSTPAGSHFINGSGNSGVIAGVQGTNGTIGYSTADLVKPIASSGPPAANVQSQWDLSIGTGLFQAPTVAAGALAIGSVTPQFDSTTRANPLAWSLQSAVTNPGVPGAYPIVGFTWIDVYQCYKNNGINPPVLLNVFFNGLYGSDSIGQIITANGFVRVPYAWQVEIFTLLNDPTLQPQLTGSGGCSGKVGAS